MNYYTRLSFNIMIVFLIAILASFIPENMPTFFGDWVCNGGKYVSTGEYTYDVQGCDYGPQNNHLPTLHWGFRHWLWLLMGTTLFIIQIVRISKIKP